MTSGFKQQNSVTHFLIWIFSKYRDLNIHELVRKLHHCYCFLRHQPLYYGKVKNFDALNRVKSLEISVEAKMLKMIFDYLRPQKQFGTVYNQICNFFLITFFYQLSKKFGPKKLFFFNFNEIGQNEYLDKTVSDNAHEI